MPYESEALLDSLSDAPLLLRFFPPLASWLLGKSDGSVARSGVTLVRETVRQNLKVDLWMPPERLLRRERRGVFLFLVHAQPSDAPWW